MWNLDSATMLLILRSYEILKNQLFVAKPTLNKFYNASQLNISQNYIKDLNKILIGE